jgi:hypothetical protein
MAPVEPLSLTDDAFEIGGGCGWVTNSSGGQTTMSRAQW